MKVENSCAKRFGCFRVDTRKQPNAASSFCTQPQGFINVCAECTHSTTHSPFMDELPEWAIPRASKGTEDRIACSKNLDRSK